MKQLSYKEKAKPPIFQVLWSVLFITGLTLSIIMTIENFILKNILITILIIVIYITGFIKSYKKQKSYSSNQKVYLKYGTKYKGKIIKTEITAHTEFRRRVPFMGQREDITVYEYYAVIEYTNEKGEKITFTTPELNGNPEYLTTKEVTVYNFDNVHYATDFGFINKPKEKFTLSGY